MSQLTKRKKKQKRPIPAWHAIGCPAFHGEGKCNCEYSAERKKGGKK